MESNSESTTVSLAKYFSNISYDNFTVEEVAQTKKLILDLLGACFTGSQTKPASIITDYINSIKEVKQATLIGHKLRTTGAYAALGNGTYAHSLELDDGHRGAMAHPGTVIIPAAMAACEKYRGNGKDFIKSVITGYEAMLKIGMAVAPTHREKHFHPTATVGCFGAAVAVGNIIGLDSKEMSNALGIAGSLASGLFEFLEKGSMVKRLHAGQAAYNGFFASELAALGYGGPDTILEGKEGFFKAFSENYCIEVFNKLGDPFEIMNTYLKPYPTCRHIHATIDGVKNIIKTHDDIGLNKIESVEVSTYKSASYLSKSSIKSFLDAQFSIPYAVAVTLESGDALLNQFYPPRKNDSKIKELMSKVKVKFDPKMEERYPETRATQVNIKVGSEIFREYIEYPKGSPENPLSNDEITSKFKDLLSDMELDCNKIISLVRNLDNIKDIRELTQYF